MRSLEQMFREVADASYSEELARELNAERMRYGAFCDCTTEFTTKLDVMAVPAMIGRARATPAILSVVRGVPPDMRYVVSSVTRGLWGHHGLIRVHDVDL